MQKENPLGRTLREELAALPGVDYVTAYSLTCVEIPAITKLGLGHFFDIHGTCVGGNAEQQNPGQAQGKNRHKRLFPVPGEIHQGQTGHCPCPAWITLRLTA